jgi:hypothetical protein
VEDDEFGVGLELAEGFAGEAAGADVVADDLAEDEVGIADIGIDHDDGNVAAFGLDEAAADAFPVDGV